MKTGNAADRFNASYNDLNFVKKDTEVTFVGEISLGDIVILKGHPDCEVEVKYINFEFNGTRMSDFAGVFISDNLDKNLRLFNRKDILEKRERSKTL